MELKWLLDFQSLAETGNFSRSAEARATTQPAFSRRIRALEQWLGATLVDRGRHPATLTPAGEAFLPIAEDILSRLFQAREEIRLVGQREESTISVAATHSLSLTFFPNLIREIEGKAGVLRIRLDSNEASHCIHALHAGECHFVLCHSHYAVDIQLPEDRFESLRLGEDRLLPVAAPDAQGRPLHALPGRPGQPIAYLGYSETSTIGRAVEFMLARRAKKPALNKVFKSQAVGVLKTITREGRGLAWLPESQIRAELDSGALVVAGDETWALPIDIRLFRARAPLPRASEQFWGILSEAYAPGAGTPRRPAHAPS
jgi:LysR family transcriptional regulator, hypochlorite-specific transcription factor HypT